MQVAVGVDRGESGHSRHRRDLRLPLASAEDASSAERQQHGRHQRWQRGGLPGTGNEGHHHFHRTFGPSTRPGDPGITGLVRGQEEVQCRDLTWYGAVYCCGSAVSVTRRSLLERVPRVLRSIR